MPNTPLLSVAVTVHNQRDVLETTLTSLYEITHIPFELFIIDDGSSDGSKEIIQSLLDYYQHEQTFYYEHPWKVGRANALNEIIPQCNAPFFWTPEAIRELDEQQLKKGLSRLSGSSAVALVEQGGLPETWDQWAEYIRHQAWPHDGSFIWNLEALPVENQFYNPFLDHFHGLELTARLGDADLIDNPSTWHKKYSADTPEFHHRQELLLTMLRKAPSGSRTRNKMITLLEGFTPGSVPGAEQQFDNDLLNEAAEMQQDGRFNDALEAIEQVLSNDPDHPAAREMKIKILEKKRRFVEASELKHEAGRTAKPKPLKPNEPTEEPSNTASGPVSNEPVSLIIPTTTYGKPALENCLVSVSEHCNAEQLELIIVDNASLDDTHDYLTELKENQFLDCKVITNERNRGFAASVNQGLEKAEGTYACIMHNDVELTGDVIGQLVSAMDAHPDYAIAGPMTNKTLNPDQDLRHTNAAEPIQEVRYIDSFCMMMRTDAGLQMDEAYELAFFDDVDFCFQANEEGHKVGIVPGAKLEHHFGTTSLDLGLDTESRQYWKNLSYFNQKWDITVVSEQELKSMSTFDQLLALDELVNPLYPEEEIKQQYERLFTDELRTEILKSRHDAETLCRLVRLFMVMEEREIMRHFEDHLENVEIPASLIYQLVRFYFERNIYSRCIHYLDQLQPQHDTLKADLYRLAIHIENKELNKAIPLLKELLGQAPANPALYKLAGDIHKFKGNNEEAGSFYHLAEQINPFEFANKEKDTFGFEL